MNYTGHYTFYCNAYFNIIFYFESISFEAVKRARGTLGLSYFIIRPVDS